MDYGIGAATVEIDVDVAFCHEMPLYNAPFVDEIDERGRGDGKYSGEKGARMRNEAKQATTVGMIYCWVRSVCPNIWVSISILF